MSQCSKNIKETIAEEFRHLGGLYFNSAYMGPGPLRAKESVLTALTRKLNPFLYQDRSLWLDLPENIRKKLATLLGVSPDNISHSTSVGDLTGLIANGYPLERGDLVCSVNFEYPSNILPWMRAVETREINFQLLELEDHIIPTIEWLDQYLPSRTKVFIISYVAFNTGKKIDLVSLGKYLKEREVFFIVDISQAFGGMALTPDEISAVDVLTCVSYKWLLGPYGHAFGYFSQKAIDKIQHRNANWTTRPKFKDFSTLLNYTTETLPGARKYDRGQGANILSMNCLEAALDFLTEIGLDYIEKHNQSLCNYFLKNYPQKKYNLITPAAHRGNIICIKTKDADNSVLESALKKNNIDASIRTGNMRLSFHVFNTIEQVDTLIETLDSRPTIS